MDSYESYSPDNVLQVKIVKRDLRFSQRY